MLFLSLKKHIPTDKMFVKSWMYVPKDQAAKYPVIPGVQVTIELPKVPEGFYKNPYRYFYESGHLRNGFGINED